jgi:ABC-type oligopeptide transport system ATPase subunit
VAQLLDVRNLTIEFPQSRVERTRVGRAFLRAQQPQVDAAFTAVRDLSFSIAPGEVLGLVGESGSGKSLTSLAIMGLLPPAAELSGEIQFQNGSESIRSLRDLDPESMRHLRGSLIAMIFQEPMTALNPVMAGGPHLHLKITLGAPRLALFRDVGTFSVTHSGPFCRPYGAWQIGERLPTAYAVGCILSPLRGLGRRLLSRRRWLPAGVGICFGALDSVALYAPKTGVPGTMPLLAAPPVFSMKLHYRARKIRPKPL